MRFLAIDVGTVRIGLAISDPSGRVATPQATLAARPQAAALDEISRIVADKRVDGVVLGLPLELDGSEGFAVRRARALGRVLAERVGVPIHEWDERLTSVDAERSLIEARVRRQRRREVIDQVAATLILQSFLDAVEREVEGDGG